jgi:hypothetical protein
MRLYYDWLLLPKEYGGKEKMRDRRLPVTEVNVMKITGKECSASYYSHSCCSSWE